ncbi:MAG: hypothetical protein PUI57_05470, partial [Oscillospiraceae bacterium]|nr:hypothetical protein [Oscillospiraceae bacterium]
MLFGEEGFVAQCGEGVCLFRRRNENRAAAVYLEDPVLAAILAGGSATREMAMQVPTVAGGIDLIANLVASTPI